MFKGINSIDFTNRIQMKIIDVNRNGLDENALRTLN